MNRILLHSLTRYLSVSERVKPGLLSSAISLLPSTAIYYACLHAVLQRGFIHASGFFSSLHTFAIFHGICCALRDHHLGIDERNRVFKRVGSSTWTGLIPTTGHSDKTGRAFRIPVEFSFQAGQGRGCGQSLLFSPPWIQPVNNPCRHHVGKLSTVQG